MSLDHIDLRILALLQENGNLTDAEVARRLDLPQTSVWRRIAHLEAAGTIRKRVALVDPAHVGVTTTVFVFIRTSQHEPGWLERFSRAVNTMPEVVEAHRLSGETDYLLKVLVADIEGYNTFYQRLIRAVPLHDVSSSFSMERVKETTAVPLAVDLR